MEGTARGYLVGKAQGQHQVPCFLPRSQAAGEGLSRIQRELDFRGVGLLCFGDAECIDGTRMPCVLFRCSQFVFLV